MLDEIEYGKQEKRLYEKIRHKTWEIVEVASTQGVDVYPLSRAFDAFILTLISLNALAVIVSTVESLQTEYASFFYAFEVFSVIVFTIEYIARIWSCTASEKYFGIAGRFKFALTPMALIDLVAILPFYLPLVGVDMRVIRSLRLVRIFRVAKGFRYVRALRLFANVLKRKKEELVLTTVVLSLLLVIASSLMYYVEHDAQPDAFSSIPATMWWAVATLTTVGYGDVYPITALGRALASVVAILGIGLFALPTGILGSGFVEEVEQRKKKEPARCPHCGELLTNQTIPENSTSPH